MKKIIIAIDGHSSCGKSTLARALALKLGFIYIDSGAMYRAVTLYFIQNEVDPTNTKAIRKALHDISISFEHGKSGNKTFLNGKKVEQEIRKMYVSEMVSEVAAVPAVRRAMVKQQQALGAEKEIVMDGRDIGTVVFPNAEVKIFLTAELEERTRRRYIELKTRGLQIDFNKVKQNLLERDRIDSTRADSPLRQAEDALVIDNTHINQEEQLERALEMVRAKVEGLIG